MPSRNRIILKSRDGQQRQHERDTLEFPAFAVETVRISSLKPYDFAWSGRSHYLALHNLRLRDGDIELEGAGKSRLLNLTHTMTFIPCGATVSGWTAPAKGENSFTALYFEPEHLSREIRELYGPYDLDPSLYFKDPVLLSTMQKLRSLVEQPHPSRIHAESLGLLAAVELFRSQRPGARARRGARGGLSRRQESLVRSYIEDHLTSDLSLEELARLVDLTRFHFARAFKVSTGLSPHQYVLQRRIERSQDLLLATDLDIGAIAQRVGFKDAPNFTRSFVKRVALTPRDFRRNRA